MSKFREDALCLWNRKFPTCHLDVTVVRLSLIHLAHRYTCWENFTCLPCFSYWASKQKLEVYRQTQHHHFGGFRVQNGEYLAKGELESPCGSLTLVYPGGYFSTGLLLSLSESIGYVYSPNKSWRTWDAKVWLLLVYLHPEPLSAGVWLDCYCTTQGHYVHKHSSVNGAPWSWTVHSLPNDTWSSAGFLLSVWCPTQVVVSKELVNDTPLPDQGSHTDFLIPMVS